MQKCPNFSAKSPKPCNHIHQMHEQSMTFRDLIPGTFQILFKIMSKMANRDHNEKKRLKC